MARMRTLKPEACWSESLAEVTREVRWTFAVLWTHCDDEGRAVNNPRVIKGALYPLDDDITPDVVAADIKELERVGSVCLYQVGAKKYLHIPEWKEHQHPNRPVPSKLPPCPKSDHSPPAHPQRSEDAVNTHGRVTPVVVVVDVDGVVDEVVEVAVPKGSRANAVRLDREWTPNPWDHQKLGYSDADASAQLEIFRDYWCAKSGRDATKLDWQATWRNWLRRARRPSPNGHVSTTDTRVAQTLALAEDLERKAIQ